MGRTGSSWPSAWGCAASWRPTRTRPHPASASCAATRSVPVWGASVPLACLAISPTQCPLSAAGRWQPGGTARGTGLYGAPKRREDAPQNRGTGEAAEHRYRERGLLGRACLCCPAVGPSLTAPGDCFAELKEDSAYGSESVEEEQAPTLALKPGAELPPSQQPQVH